MIKRRHVSTDYYEQQDSLGQNSDPPTRRTGFVYPSNPQHCHYHGPRRGTIYPLTPAVLHRYTTRNLAPARNISNCTMHPGMCFQGVGLGAENLTALQAFMQAQVHDRTHLGPCFPSRKAHKTYQRPQKTKTPLAAGKKLTFGLMVLQEMATAWIIACRVPIRTSLKKLG
ncbi:hypothetical protein BJV78DRAFT_960355 [Lactifluus subvellereus]|nr:hypothetical protein BJV78DRAFT_960355 [Lactifluus subvellereus]